jgi:hypothetical protein
LIVINTFVYAYKYDKSADKKENINPYRTTETGKWGRKVYKYYQQGSNTPKVLDGFEVAFQMIAFKNIRLAR